MKKFLKITGIILGVILLLILCVAAWINWGGMPGYEVKPITANIKTDSLTLAKGQKVAENICAYCHRGEDGRLSGRLIMKPDSPFGEIWSGNLTKDPDHGLGRYSDGELLYLLRTGIKRDGHPALPFMIMNRMADEDLNALVAYLRSDAPSVAPVAVERTSKLGFLPKALFKLGAIKPVEYKGEPIIAPPPSDQVAYGRYISASLYFCAECHSASFETFDQWDPEKSPGYFGGGNVVEDLDLNPVLSANITPHPEYGIGNWTEEQFRLAVRNGINADGRALSFAMPKFALLSDEELSAIWAYLRTVPPLDNQVVREATAR